jgi:hypothetical protein
VTYAPPGRFCWGWPSLLVWPPFLVLLWAMCKWIRWNARNLFFADLEQGAAPEGTASPTWAALTAPGDRFLVMQIFEENLANPGQAREVERLIKAGFLRLNPDLQPATAEFCAEVGKKAEDPAFCAELGKWEQVEGAHSWRYMRTVVVAGLAALAAILFQSEITALAGAVAAGLTTLSKLREAIGAWLPSAAKGDGS